MRTGCQFVGAARGHPSCDNLSADRGSLSPGAAPALTAAAHAALGPCPCTGRWGRRGGLTPTPPPSPGALCPLSVKCAISGAGRVASRAFINPGSVERAPAARRMRIFSRAFPACVRAPSRGPCIIRRLLAVGRHGCSARSFRGAGCAELDADSIFRIHLHSTSRRRPAPGDIRERFP
jgi:hypothetical protein